MQNLPAEILGMIGMCIALEIDEDCEKVRRSTLLALTLCCRKFHKIFEPILYYHLDLGYDHPLTVAHIHLIIRFWKHPEVADWVRSLKLYWDHDEPIPVHDASNDDFDVFSPFVSQALDKMFTSGPRFTDMWEEYRDCLLEFEMEAWIGVLFVSLSRLERIEFDHQDSVLFNDLLYKAAKREQPFHETAPFPFLREVVAHCQDEGQGIHEDFLTPFLYFPNVQSITGYSIWANKSREGRKPYIYSYEPPLPVGPVRQISLDDIWGCTGMLDWLKVCKELEHFSIEASLHSDTRVIERRFDTQKLYQALLPFKDTLKSLSVTYDKQYNICLEMNGGIGVRTDNIPFESFREFSVLEHLTVRHAHLVPIFSNAPVKKSSVDRLVDRLPSSLQTLAVQDVLSDNSRLLAELLMVAQDRSSFPHLKSLELRDKPLEDLSASDDETIPDGTTVGGTLTLEMSFAIEEVDKEIEGTKKLRRECEARGIDMQWFMEGETDNEEENGADNAGH
ncbi:hypothetical protein ABHI18_003686 [Aspergillus niger]